MFVLRLGYQGYLIIMLFRMVSERCRSTTRKCLRFSQGRRVLYGAHNRWNTLKTFDDILNHLEADIVCFQGVLISATKNHSANAKANAPLQK
jgi:hypothetical protein